jgi:Tfp pilus assembly protein PilF
MELITFYAQYYLAQSYMSTNNMTNAIQELQNAIKIAPDKIWESKIQWYLALAYLKTDQIIKTKILLKEVANKELANNYKQRAINLINDLKKE